MNIFYFFFNILFIYNTIFLLLHTVFYIFLYCLLFYFFTQDLFSYVTGSLCDKPKKSVVFSSLRYLFEVCHITKLNSNTKQISREHIFRFVTHFYFCDKPKL